MRKIKKNIEKLSTGFYLIFLALLFTFLHHDASHAIKCLKKF